MKVQGVGSADEWVERWWWVALVAILLVATGLRVWNLGSFSLWLDEVFTFTIASEPLKETLAASAADAENVPMYAVIANLGLKLGADEVSLRFAPIAAGLASILLLSLWTRRHFGAAVSLLTASFCAVSAFHLRYSQEIRAYPYLLLVSTATLLVADRLRRKPDWTSTGALAAVVAAGCYTHLTYPLVLIPVAGSLALEPRTGPTRRVIGHFAAGVGLGLLAFVPWIWMISQNLVDRMPQNWTSTWTMKALGSRWQVLTIAGREYERASWFGLVLAAIAVVGVAGALRSRAGRAVLVPGLATLVGWELLLVAIEHWTVARYDTVLWPFLAILVALGCHQVLVWLRWRWLQIPVAAAVAAMMVVHLGSYYRDGRPHWDELAKVVVEARRTGEPVVTDHHWASTCLTHYLGEEVPTVAGDPVLLATAVGKAHTVLLVIRNRDELLDTESRATRIADIRWTARVYRLYPVEPTLRRPEQPSLSAMQ